MIKFGSKKGYFSRKQGVRQLKHNCRVLAPTSMYRKSIGVRESFILRCICHFSYVFTLQRIFRRLQVIILPTPENVKRHTPAGEDLFSTVPCNSDWQKCSPVGFFAIRLGFPLARISVSQSCSEQLKTPSSLAGGVAFVPICCELYPICHELKFQFVRPNMFCPNPPGPTGPIFWSPADITLAYEDPLTHIAAQSTQLLK